ncbi:MAG TPA: thermonuclease family protein [Chloroflexaceae bacterium]|nr:thermonuclease family protein [Chloroflexaceae bacterium]
MRPLPLLSLTFALLLAACEVRIDVTPPADLLPPTSAPADLLPSAPAPRPAGDYPPLPEGLPRATVVRVIDGDTILVDVGGREERVRFIGINTPESVDPRRPVECFGAEASDNAKAMLDGRAVLLEDDPSQDSRDSSGRLLSYVWLEDGRMANLEQIVQGFAAEYTYSTPYKYRDLFRDAQREARDAGRGLWSPETCGGQFTPLGEAPAPTPPASGAAPAPASASCPRAPEAPAAPETPLRIVGLDKVGEVVELANVGFEPVSLDGWVLCSVRGGESQAGLSGTLAPGEARAFPNPGNPIWSNSNRDDAALYDPAGRLVSYWVDG